MAEALTRARKPRSGRRKIALILIGLAMIGAGILVFRYASDIAGQVGDLIGPPPSSGDNITGSGFSQAGYLPFIVWGFGFTLIGSGAAMIRSAFLSSMTGSMGGMGMGGAAGGMSEDSLNAYMQQALSASQRTAMQAGAVAPAAKEVVKIKCRNCGSLEAEDAAFCRKCGQPI